MAHQRNIGADQGTSLSSAPAGIPKRRRLAGPSAASRKDLVEMATSETLLEQVVRQARHIVLREGTMVVLDTLAKELKDPLISCHWTTLNSPTQTSVKVKIIMVLDRKIIAMSIFWTALLYIFYPSNHI